MGNSELSAIILNETLLMKEHVRNNPDKIAELLNDNFIEFTSSGKQYNYSFGDTFGASKPEPPLVEVYRLRRSRCVAG